MVTNRNVCGEWGARQLAIRYLLFFTNCYITPLDLLMAPKACESLLMKKESNPDLWLNNGPVPPANSAAKPSLTQG